MNTDPTSPEALEAFLDGLEEKMGASFGLVSTPEERRDVKRKIAEELGVEEEYVPLCASSVADSEEAFRARRRVHVRYRKLLEEGKVDESEELTESRDRRREWHERLNAHLRGEETTFSTVDNTL